MVTNPLASQLVGSSPRERGARHRHQPRPRCLRLIPARAGSTIRTAARGSRGWAHPRASGEHHRRVEGMLDDLGSSPRERGALLIPGCERLPPGLIPARAGSTTSDSRRCGTPWAHPRASGEHFPLSLAPLNKPGSSPRERGARFGRDARPGRRGLIPARAGSTRQPRRGGARSRAHPRASGEHAQWEQWISDALGSSPRERGARGTTPRTGGSSGLIPARAGSTMRDA